MTPIIGSLANRSGAPPWPYGESMGQTRIKNWIQTGDSSIPLSFAQTLDFNLFLSYDDLYRAHYREDAA